MRKVILLFATVVALFAVGCSDDEKGVRTSEVTVEVKLPEEYSTVSLDSVEVVLKNTSTGSSYSGKTDQGGLITLVVEEGIYDINASVKKRAEDNHGAILSFQGSKNSTAVTGNTMIHQVTMQLAALDKEWLIREVYLTFSKTTAGKSYQKDAYFVLYNNTNETLYADGLSICETYQTTAAKQPSANPADWKQFWPGRIAVAFIYTVPGTGKEHAVAPGGNLVIADLAVNHTLAEYNSTSKVDMSKADFEWYDEGTTLDSDVPEVPNMIKTFSTSKTVWLPNSQGNKSYFIFKLDEGMDMAAFLQENNVTNVLMPNGKDYYDTYAIPVQYIYDAVEFSSQQSIVADKALPSALDNGFSYSSGTGSGKAVRRKVASWDGDRAILQDTNNSSNDFVAAQDPSPYTVPKN